MKVIFFGTSPFALPVLSRMNEEFEVLKVFTAPPRPANRGQKLQKTPIHIAAEGQILPVVTPAKLAPDLISESFDIGVVVSYGLILPESVLKLAHLGFINVHPSDLPLFRGAAPIERTLEAGFEQTRICIIKMTPRLDDGDIIISKTYNIDEDETAIELHHKFAYIGGELAVQACKILQSGAVNFEKQDDSRSTYAKKIKKSELFLSREEVRGLECRIVLNKIRAFNAHGCAYIMEKGYRIKIKYAKILPAPATELDLECADGFISPMIIIPEGKREMDIKDYLNK